MKYRTGRPRFQVSQGPLTHARATCMMHSPRSAIILSVGSTGRNVPEGAGHQKKFSHKGVQAMIQSTESEPTVAKNFGSSAMLTESVGVDGDDYAGDLFVRLVELMGRTTNYARRHPDVTSEAIADLCGDYLREHLARFGARCGYLARARDPIDIDETLGVPVLEDLPIGLEYSDTGWNV